MCIDNVRHETIYTARPVDLERTRMAFFYVGLDLMKVLM